MFELYPLCLVADEDEDVGDVVDAGYAVNSGTRVVWFLEPSKVLFSIAEGRFEVYTCPPRIGGHGTVVTGPS